MEIEGSLAQASRQRGRSRPHSIKKRLARQSRESHECRTEILFALISVIRGPRPDGCHLRAESLRLSAWAAADSTRKIVSPSFIKSRRSRATVSKYAGSVFSIFTSRV